MRIYQFNANTREWVHVTIRAHNSPEHAKAARLRNKPIRALSKREIHELMLSNAPRKYE